MTLDIMLMSPPLQMSALLITWSDIKVIWKANIANFWIKYFHLICHLILTKINCITLKICSKADFKSKSQNIWQQIILLSRTVMQRICTWPKIWTLSGRLSLMRIVQLMKKNKNIFRMYHIKIITKKIGSHDRKQTDSSIIIVRNVCVLTSTSMIVYLFFTRSWSAIIGKKQPKVNQSPQQWRGRQTCTRICRFLVVGNTFRLEAFMNSLVKVPPYSKLNFQGQIFFTQNWCNITLSYVNNKTY
jgi:hypothetical protein